MSWIRGRVARATENDMSLKDDPRLTAYALGEMPEGERAEFEALLAGDAEAQAEIEAIRALTGELRVQLKREETSQPRSVLQPQARWRALAAAATVAVMGLVGWSLVPTLNRAREVAILHDPVIGGTPSTQPLLEISQQTLATKVLDSATANPTPQPAAKGVANAQNRTIGTVDAGILANAQLQLAPAPSTVNEPTLRATLTPAITPASSLAGDVANTSLATIEPHYSKISAQVASKSGDTLMDQLAALRADVEEAKTTYGSSSREMRAAHSKIKELEDRIKSAAPSNTESYARIYDNPFLDALSNPLSTFSVDVDTASYSNVRRYLNSGTLPPPDAVRIEELINYFPTSDAPPTDDRPFAVYSEVASCPWAPSHQLVRVAIKGKELAREQRPLSNLVFLIDVSGSMNEPDKLPLVKQSMQKLVDSLGENDRVAIVVYAGASGLALPSTSAMSKEQIRQAIDKLQPGGSTNGAQGIELAYAQAQANFITGGTNRVILCTDGDFNVGITDRGQLTRLIEEKAKAGVFLSVLGFGTGNTKDDTMEALADKGNGNYAYIDSEREAEKVLAKEMSGTLVTIAKDVKLQLEFNPAKVKSYRLIGYENRVLAKEDFNNDLQDAGEIGAGHHVVALYEIEPGEGRFSGPGSTTNRVDALKYQAQPQLNANASSDELLSLKLRYKAPDAPLEQGTSQLIEFTLKDADRSMDQASKDFQWASAVAAFGMMLRDSPHKGTANWDLVSQLAEQGGGEDREGYQAEFRRLVEVARQLRK